MEHLTDTEFEAQFAACTLDPKYFTHAAHVRLAWILLRRYGLAEAIEHINEQIRRYDRVHGDGTKYHRTLTVAAVHIVQHFVRQSQEETFDAFIRKYPGLRTEFRELIGRHYSDTRLGLPEARSGFLEPDLEAFS